MIKETAWWETAYNWISSFFSTDQGAINLVLMFAALLFGIFLVIAIISLVASAFGSKHDNQ